MHATEDTTHSTLTPPAIGQPWPGEGGIYAGILPAFGDQPAVHLIISADEAAQPLEWGPYGTEVTNADSRSNGRANTAAIMAHKALHGGDFTAAEWASQYTADGKADFHLPSQAELFFISLQPAVQMRKAWHWSSTQDSGGNAFVQSFEYGLSIWRTKGYDYRVRAVRWIPL